MTRAVRSADIPKIQEAQRVLLSPTAHPRLDDWRDEVHATLKDLLGADLATFALPIPGETHIYSGDVDLGYLSQYPKTVKELAWHDAAYKKMRREGVWTRRSLNRPWATEFYRSEYYHEFVVPIRAFDAVGLALPMDGSIDTAILFLHHEKQTGPKFGRRGLEILRLLHPAFDAGIHALLDHRKRQGSLASVVDGADEAILLFDFGGNLVHQNPAAVKILSALDANSRILEAVKSKARCLVAELHTRGNDKKHCYLPASSVVNVVHGMFEIKGSYLCGESISDVISVMVTVRQKPGRLPERNETQDQFKLTQRESNVALLLAKRLSNAEIAELLNISEHTARHHTERVLRKLRVASRKHVGDRLRENRIDRGASAE